MWQSVTQVVLLATVPALGAQGATERASQSDTAVLGHIDKRAWFLGFSADESLSAWRVRVSHRHQTGRFTDHYTLFKVADTLTNEVVGLYRGTQIWRTSRSGRRRLMRRTDMVSSSPDWQRAQSHDGWTAVKLRERFAAATPVVDSQTLDIIPDTDVDLSSHRQGWTIRISTGKNRSLGFRPVVMLPDGRQVFLAHFRQAGGAGLTLSARLEVFTSQTTRHIAVLNRFEIESPGGTRSVSFGSVVQVGVKPSNTDVAASAQKMAALADWYAEQTRRLAQQLHDGATLLR